MEKGDFTLKGRIWGRNCWETEFVSTVGYFFFQLQCFKNGMGHLKKGCEIDDNASQVLNLKFRI